MRRSRARSGGKGGHYQRFTPPSGRRLIRFADSKGALWLNLTRDGVTVAGSNMDDLMDLDVPKSADWQTITVCRNIPDRQQPVHLP